jgi:hypothetical protein
MFLLCSNVKSDSKATLRLILEAANISVRSKTEDVICTYMGVFDQLKGVDTVLGLGLKIIAYFVAFGVTGALVMSWVSASGTGIIGFTVLILILTAINLIPKWRTQLAFALLAVSIVCGILAVILIIQTKSPAAAADTKEVEKINSAKSRPEFLRNAVLGIGFNDEQPPLAFGGTSMLTTERLRVFVDYSIYRSGWMSRVRVPIGEIKDPAKDEYVRIQLAYKGTKQNGGVNDLWWGSDSAPAHPVANPVYGELPVTFTRGRVVVIGPSNKEQYVYFELTRIANDANGQFRFAILQGRDVSDWINRWETE